MIETVIVAIPMLKQENLVPFIVEKLETKPKKIIVNGTGIYQYHSAVADCGITGRKLACDFYSVASPIGGGSPWTKDASKADVSLNLYARKLAKEFSEKEGKTVRTELACCIGKSEVSYQILEPCGTVIENGTIHLTPEQVRNEFFLHTPIFTSMATFGLFGEFQRDKQWELA